MGVTQKDVQKIASLARLSFSPDEERKLTIEMNEILGYMDKLNTLDTSDVEPLYHVIEMETVFREDEVKPSLPQEEALKNAPKKFGAFFTVPKVLD